MVRSDEELFTALQRHLVVRNHFAQSNHWPESLEVGRSGRLHVPGVS